jgi:hypothetical protein
VTKWSRARFLVASLRVYMLRFKEFILLKVWFVWNREDSTYVKIVSDLRAEDLRGTFTIQSEAKNGREGPGYTVHTKKSH